MPVHIRLVGSAHGEQQRLTDAFPAPGAARPPAQPSGSSRPVQSTGRAELSGFGNARNVSCHCVTERGSLKRLDLWNPREERFRCVFPG